MESMYAALAPTFVALAVLAAACSGSNAPEVTQTSTPPATPSPDAAATLDETLDAIEARTSAIRGLESDGGFNVRFASEAELAEIVDGLSLNADTGPLVTALGLAASNVSIATSEIEGGAFVSPPATIFVVGDASDGLDDDEVSIYVHEYTHFLQEAVFGSPDIDPRNLDAQFAQLALREGDAVRVEQAYQRRHLREVRPELELPLRGSMADRFVTGLTLFIYGGGPRLIDALGGAGSIAVDAAFIGPLTTEQVIHPEKYTSGEVDDAPSEAAILAQLGLDAAELFDRAILGEFFFLGWLTAMQADGAFSAASGWGGDLALALNEADGFVVVLRIAWDDPVTDIGEFEAALSSGLDAAEEFTPLSDAGLAAWAGPGGVLSFGSDGTTTTIVVAATRARAAELVALAGG